MAAFKDFISGETVNIISLHLGRHLDNFDAEAFSEPLVERLSALELKKRVQLIADALHVVLPRDHRRRRQVLETMLHPETTSTTFMPSDDSGIRGWGLWPLTRVVGQYGLEDFDSSLALLREMTKRGTAEFDVRPYIDADYPRALQIIATWTKDENVHVRRLASEGTRPRLPWGMRLKNLVQDPRPCLPILMELRDDPEDYVRRSVANHLNDIAKDHPDLVAELATEWLEDAPTPRRKLIRHACRTLIKGGHRAALKAFGVERPLITQPKLKVTTPVVNLGGALEFEFTLASKAKEPQRIILDYAVHFMKANGSGAAKVFKWKQLTLMAGEKVQMKRRHAIRPATTRKYYPGEHAVSLWINGTEYGHEAFQLVFHGSDADTRSRS